MKSLGPTSIELAKRTLSFVEAIGLIIIGIATIIATSIEIMHMFEVQRVVLQDLLLLFIFLEVLAMVGLYFESGQLPVRYPIYIAIVALARYLILGVETMEPWRIVGIASAMFVLSLTVLALRYGHAKFPYIASERNTWPRHKPPQED
ncbi:MAG: phosphate-starvation-inducible PsiE family protein [Pseudomonadota bacterium]